VSQTRQTEQSSPTYIPIFVSEAKIYPRSVQGIYAQWRWVVIWITQLVFYGLPWLQWGQRPAVLFDLEARRFYIFDLVLYPQDFIYLAVLLIICALSLFLVTAIAGRVWCGYACPQTVYSEIFIWIERKIEGDRQKRMRLDQANWGINKFGRKAAKHTAWLLLSLWTGLSFVAYFVPLQTLFAEICTWQLGPWEAFWILFYGFATYGNAGFMREQVCKYMCPYARFQGAMFDKDTLIISYDERRGEPRGSRSKMSDPKSLGLGDCVDCTLCVQVCPTGIDIRKGLQYECIGCAACIDVCNGVMKKLDYAPGLIRYSTQQALQNNWSNADIWKRLRRTRIWVYLLIWVSICSAWVISLSMRHEFRVDVVRDRGVLSRIVANGRIENIYRLQLMNATDREQRLQIRVEGLPDIDLNSANRITLRATQSQWIVVGVDMPISSASSLKPGSHPIVFLVSNDTASEVVREKSVFYVPR
jgi:cytochrome c oxidase accessory protein FixG